MLGRKRRPGGPTIQSWNSWREARPHVRGLKSNALRLSAYRCQSQPAPNGRTTTRGPRSGTADQWRGRARTTVWSHQTPARATKTATVGGLTAAPRLPASTATSASGQAAPGEVAAGEGEEGEAEEQGRRLDHERPRPEEVQRAHEPERQHEQPPPGGDAELGEEEITRPERGVEQDERDGPARGFELQAGGRDEAHHQRLIQGDLVRNPPGWTQQGGLVGEPRPPVQHEVGREGGLGLAPAVGVRDRVRPADRRHGDARQDASQEQDEDRRVFTRVPGHRRRSVCEAARFGMASQ